MKNMKGITLIALVITIIVMLILVAVTINVALNGGLFDKAKTAATETEKQAFLEQIVEMAEYNKNGIDVQETWNKVQASELEIVGTPKETKNDNNALTEVEFSIQGKQGTFTYKITDTGIKIENGEEKKYLGAWVYDGTSWSNWQEGYAEEPTGTTIVAKLYATGNKITPPEIVYGNTYTFTEGPEYIMEITGNGEMGELVKFDDGPTEGFAWQSSLLEYMIDQSTPMPYTPYITKVTVGKDVTNIGQGAFLAASSLTNIAMPYVEEIERDAFAYCKNLETLTAPAVTTIGKYAFDSSTSLNKIEIPVATTIGAYAFSHCSSLNQIEIPSSVITVEENLFCRTSTRVYCPGLTQAPNTWDSSWLGDDGATVFWNQSMPNSR